jgi:NAD(P)H-flavin reductase
MHLIHSNTIIRPSIGKMIVEAPYVAQHRKAGQFIILRIDESGERIPLTIADTDPSKGTITLYYQIMGTTTTRLSQLKDNDSILDIAGPLGHPTEIQQYGHAVCVGGGIGTAPLLPIVRALKEAGNTVSVIGCARSEKSLILAKRNERSLRQLLSLHR